MFEQDCGGGSRYPTQSGWVEVFGFEREVAPGGEGGRWHQLIGLSARASSHTHTTSTLPEMQRRSGLWLKIRWLVRKPDVDKSAPRRPLWGADYTVCHVAGLKPFRLRIPSSLLHFYHHNAQNSASTSALKKMALLLLSLLIVCWCIDAGRDPVRTPPHSTAYSSPTNTSGC